ncbi:MAG: glucosamine-6-phosphate deaminase [Clostridia bacterium]|nr:glucosamine-6-phosphate deaminase [Clostridia bacterium]
MDVKIFNTAEEIGVAAAEIIINKIKADDSAILGLATGSSPIPTYNELIKAYNNNVVSFKNVKSFNLDEYCGIPASDRNSYYTFMHQNLFNSIDIKEENTQVPDGNPEDVEVFCKGYDEAIKNAGGIDIQVLGIGRNGHIGFNEPAEKFTKGTYKVKLTESTIEANKRFFDKVEDVPTEAITMGVESILDAKEIILIATGTDKAQAIHDMVKGEVSPACPASILQKHSNVHIFIDKDAASLI